MIYVLAAMAFSSISPIAGEANVLEKLAMAIHLQGQRQFLVNNWYLRSEFSNFSQVVGFLDSECETELRQFEMISADLNSHDPLWDQFAIPTEI